MDAINWSVVNTAMLVGAIGYMVRQARAVDTVRQALIGIEGQGGALSEIKMLRERTHDLANKLTILNATVEELTRVMENRAKRRETP